MMLGEEKDDKCGKTLATKKSGRRKKFWKKDIQGFFAQFLQIF